MTNEMLLKNDTIRFELRARRFQVLSEIRTGSADPIPVPVSKVENKRFQLRILETVWEPLGTVDLVI